MNLKLETNSNKAKSFDEEILNSFIKQHLYLYSEKIILRWSSNELIFVHVCWNRSLEINWTVKHFRRITMNDVHWALNLFIYIQNAILNENANQSSEKQNEKKKRESERKYVTKEKNSKFHSNLWLFLQHSWIIYRKSVSMNHEKSIASLYLRKFHSS